MKLLKVIKEKTVAAFYAAAAFVASHKITSAVIVAAVAGITAAAIVVTSILSAPVSVDKVFSSSGDVSSAPSLPEITVSEPQDASSEIQVPSEAPVSSEAPTVSTPPVAPPPVVNTEFQYNSNMSPDNNVFLDALAYTGYKLDKERASGRMWGSFGNYVRCTQKKGLGWLSNITYGGGTSGYEVDANGKPNIHRFEQGGLVCATYVAYVYFNYLPNVAGIDTSSLTKAERSYDANAWYIAAQDWVNKGYSRYIDFTANDNGSINQDIKFTEAEDIPIGSIICMQDWYNRNGHCTHVSIYAGYVNGYHWVTHVGNENGPEFCAIERMNRKPHPQWPLAIITTPNNIRFSAAVEVTVTDQDGNPVSDAAVSAKHTASGTVTELGKTDQNGKLIKEGLSYGEYQIIQTVPSGYICDSSALTVNLNTQNNSLNKVSFSNQKQIPLASSTEENTSN